MATTLPVEATTKPNLVADMEYLPPRELLQLCVTRTELAVNASDRAALASEQARAAAAETRVLVQKLGTNLLLAQHGVPLSRSGRWAVAGAFVLTIVISAAASVGVVACYDVREHEAPVSPRR